MKIRMLIAAVLVAGVVPALALGGHTMAPMHATLSAKLVGSSEVPPGADMGEGIANITLNASKGTVCWAFTDVKGISAMTASHIHKGKPGVSGPVVVPFGGSYKAKGCTTASKATIDAIETSPNSYYVNIHTKKYPNGAIRGELVVGMMHM